MARPSALVLLAVPQLALGATLTVPSASYPTIQSAIDAATTGDVVEVGPGTYSESLSYLGKAITVRSTDGAASTTLEAPKGAGYAVTFVYGETSSAVLEDFTIESPGTRGAYISYSSPTFDGVVFTGLGSAYHDGGAVYLYSGSPTFTGCTFTGNLGEDGAHVYLAEGSTVAEPAFVDTTFTLGDAANQGGAIFIESGSPTLSGCTLDSNVSTSAGGAIHVGPGGQLTAEDTEFLTNSSDSSYGGAIYVDGDDGGAGSVELDQCTFVENGVDPTRQQGGAVYLDTGSTAVITDTRFEANTAYRGAAISSNGDMYTELCTFVDNTTGYGAVATYGITYVDRYSTFDGNVGTEDGGAISAQATHVDLLGTTFVGNSSDKAGTIYLYQGSCSIRDTTFSNNSCSSQGAALHIQGGDGLAVRGSTFEDNSVDPYSGGAVFAADPDGTLVIEDCTFDGNQAGGSYGMGGAILTVRTDVQITGSTFVSNHAQSGGAGIYANEGSIQVHGTRFDGNTTPGNGAAIYLYSGYSGTGSVSLELSSSLLVDNSATGMGAAVYSYKGTSHTLTDNAFTGNSSGRHGGAVSLTDPSSNLVVRNRFCANTAAEYGGAVYSTVSETPSIDTWSNNVFHLNAADERGGAVCLIGHPAPELVNNTFVANSSLPPGPGGVPAGGLGGTLYTYGSFGSGGEFRNNIVVWGSGVEALYVDDTATGDALASVFWYNDLWANTPGDFGGELYASDVTGQGNVALDPEFGAYVIDADCDNDWFTLKKASTVRDLGDDGEEYTDLDGTRNDPGAYGGPDAWISDGDGDEYPLGEDCDDDDEVVYPGAEETPYDGEDQDCDGADLVDVDGDGYDSEVVGGDDCDDGEESVYPGAPETWYDGEDSSCHGRSDYDQDGDGRAHDGYGGDDCLDTDPLAYPGADEIWYDGIDQACDGGDDYDQDGDGFASDEHEGTDCDDVHADAYPGGTEVWYDGIDQDCAGDDDFDQDEDGFAWEAYGGEDCDDEEPEVNPDATEVWNEVDDDCDDLVDPDTDEDGIIDSTEEDWGADPESGDSDDDGIPDGDEWGEEPDAAPVDTDGDEDPDVTDPDSDDDGVPDEDEGLTDTDGDGTPDYRDDDDDDDGLPTVDENDDDTDGDGLVNYLDPDSDGDGAWDGAEGTDDSDGDGIPDWLDDGADGDEEPPTDDDRGFGFGCSSAPGAAGWVVLGLVALAGRRRRR